MNVKTGLKKLFAITLVVSMILQMLPVSMFETKAADTSETVASGQEYTNTETDVKFKLYKDISQYRGTDKTYPKKDGYVFAGWYTGVTEEAKDSTATPISTDTISGSAWAKFVPEEVLSVKAQVSHDITSVSENQTVKLRLVTTVDSMRYNEIGFKIKFNGSETENTYGSQEVYKEITVADDYGRKWTETPSDAFHKASIRFATVKITGFTESLFTTYELAVTPYWITKDGTTVTGVSRNRILVSDDLMTYSDGSKTVDNEDFATSNNDTIYTYNNSTIGTAASYKYFKGGSDTVYLAGTYKSAGTGNHFGITIRNGGQTRQVFYDGMGVNVYSGEDISSATAIYNTITNSNGVFIWSQTGDTNNTNVTARNSAVSTMLNSDAGTSHHVIWAIEENTLYGSVNGDVFLRIPMTVLCSEWRDGRYYQLGVASYNSSNPTASMTFTKENLQYGKDAYGTTDEPLLVAEKEDVIQTNMAYEAIEGSYMSASNASGYAYRKSAAGDSQIAMETTLKWQNMENSRSGAGLTVKSGSESRQIYFEYNTDNKYQIRRQPEHGWGNSDTGGTNYSLRSKFYSNPFAQDECNMKVAVYDGKLSVLINDITAYESMLSSSDLFGSTYSADNEISIGVATWDSKNGQAQFKDVTFYEGQDAIDLKTENWTFHPGVVSDTNLTFDTKTGTVNKVNGAVNTISTIPLGTETDVWEVTGIMTHEGAGQQGFAVGPSNGTNLYLLGQSEAFECRLNGKWSSDIYRYNTGTNKYAFQKNSLTNSKYFDSTNADTTLKFKIIVANDTVYVWLNDVFSWMVPLNETEFGGASTGAEHILRLAFADSSTKQAFTNIKTKTGKEVSVDLIKILKVAKDLDWLAANTMKSLSSDGKVYTLNTDSSGDSHVISTTGSTDVWLSGTWELLRDKTKYFGITLSDGTNNRQVRFDHEGIYITKSNTWDAADGGRAIYNQANKSDFDTGAKYYIWAQYKVRGNDSTSKSVIKSMLNDKAYAKHNIIWAIQNDTLYCSVDGVTSVVLPLSELCSSWTMGSGTNYRIGFSQWGPKDNGDVKVSDIELLYGTEASAKLIADASVGIASKTMVYAPIHGVYMPRTKTGCETIYGNAAKTVAVQADIYWENMANTNSGAGISVKSNGKSMEIYVQGENVQVRKQPNQVWGTTNDENTGTNRQIASLLTPGTKPFDSNGKCHVTAIVENDILYVMYNGMSALELNLEDYIDDYVAGADVQIGLATWDANLGACIFKNISLTTGDAAKNLLTSEWNFYPQAESGVINATITAGGNISKSATTGGTKVTFNGSSDKWLVEGTMKQQDLYKYLLQGFEIQSGTKKVRLYGHEYGFGRIAYTSDGKESWTDSFLYNNIEKEGATNYIPENNVDYYGFFHDVGTKDQTNNKRSRTEINFKVLLCDDTFYAYFDDELMWEIPLTETYFGGFEAGSSYQLSLVTQSEAVGASFENIKVLKGSQITNSLSVASNSGATIDEIAGTVTRAGTVPATVYLEGSSKSWEVTGSMEQKDLETLILQGFVVKARVNERKSWYKDANDEYTYANQAIQETRFYGQGNGFVVVGPLQDNDSAPSSTNLTWNFDYNGMDKTEGSAGAAKHYAMNHNSIEYFRVASTENPRTDRRVSFRLVIADDILYLWVEDVLTWKIPLSVYTFGSYEPGSMYQLGLAFNGVDEGTASFKNLKVKSGLEVDLSDVNRFGVIESNVDKYDTVAGIVERSNSESIETLYFAGTETDNSAKRWEVSGTMYRSDLSQNVYMGFAVRSYTGNTMKENRFFGQAEGFVPWYPWSWDYNELSKSTATDYIFNSDIKSFFGSPKSKLEIEFRALIVEDILYVYFDDVLSWKIPLTETAFGGFVSGSSYEFGVTFNNTDAGTAGFKDLEVKSGKEILTEDDIFIRDTFVLADNGVYYLYGSRHGGSFDVFTSRDLITWEMHEPCFVPNEDFWGVSTDYWAPEVHKYTYNGETSYYMFATFRGDGETDTRLRGTQILKADSPLGPFKEWSVDSNGKSGPVTPLSLQSLDGTLYVESDGTPYIVFCHEYTASALSNTKNGEIYYMKLSKDLKQSDGTPVKILDAKTAANLAEGLRGYVTDGPQLYKTADGKLFLLWSTFADGNGKTTDNRYLQLQIRSQDGTLAGLKEGSHINGLPLLYGNDTEDGGHGMIFTDFDSNKKLILHTPNFYQVEKSCTERLKIMDVNYDETNSYLTTK